MEEGLWLDAGAVGVRFGLAEYAGGAKFFCVYHADGFGPDVAGALSRAGFVRSTENPNLFGRPASSLGFSPLGSAETLGVPHLDLREVAASLRSVFPNVVVVPSPTVAAATRPVSKESPFPTPVASVGEPRPVDVREAPPLAAPAPYRVPARPGARPQPPKPVEPPVTPVAEAAPAETASVPPPSVSRPPAAPTAPPRPAGVSARPMGPSRRVAASPPPAAQRGVRVDRPVLPPGQINPYQMKYAPESKVGSPIAAIPLNLAGPTAAALKRVALRHGDVDAFVAARLGWGVEEMGGYLSPEQVDAVALAIDSSERGQGFVLADATGLGKGRVLAAVCRAVVLAGKPAIFVTEKENLFSDLWRDIVDIGSADLFGRPFMLNDGATIVDGSSAEVAVVHDAWLKKDVSTCLRKKALPPGCKLMFATYTQFNKVGSPKAEFLRAVAAGNHLMCDESHNAVGDSATSQVLSEAMDGASAVTYSSATFAKHAANLAAYKRLFPASMRSSDLMEVLATGGQAISEALSQMLAEDGAYLRREHDLSDLTIEVVDDMGRLARNRAFSDALYPVLARVAKLSREVASIVQANNEPGPEDARPKKGGKEFWSTGNFGARLALLVRQFTTALSVDLCVEKAVEALAAGRKPVVVVESTMESLMRELASDGAEGLDETVADDAAAESVLEGEAMAVAAGAGEGAQAQGDDAPGRAPPLPPTFRDALNLLVDRTMQISVRRGRSDPEKVDVEDPALVAEASAIKRLVEGFPDLPLSPIDDVREGIQAASLEMVAEGRLAAPWVVEEISARSMSVVGGDYVQRAPPDRVATVARFQNGVSDAIILTRAASTGLSLHASEKVSDQRVRVMIELQIPSNVVERVQFWGRVKRRGQVCEPRFMSLTCGLELQMRQLAVQNRKVADLSANVSASAASAAAMDVPDIIDPIGNAIAKRILEEQPGLADDMHIALRLKDMETAERELYHVNKLLQRLVLLPSFEQQRVYREVLAAYSDALREMKAKGESPRGAREMPGEWKVVDEDTFEPGDPRDGKVFGRPVKLATIETMRDRQPLGYEAVAELVARAEERLGAEPFSAHLQAIDKARPDVLAAALSKRSEQFFINWQAALKDRNENSVKAAAERIDRLRGLLRSVRPGNDIVATGADGTENGVVVDVRAPRDLAAAHHPGRWTIRYVVPGDEAPREISAAAAIRDGSIAVMGSRALSPALKRRFDKAPRGLSPERRRILTGNPVKAVISARKAGWGSMATWRDADGRLNRAVLVPRDCSVEIDPSLTGRTPDVAVALAVIGAGGMVWTNPDRPEGGARLERTGGGLAFEVPADKRILQQFQTPAVLSVTGPLKGTAAFRFAEVPLARERDLLAALAADGHAFNYDGRFRRAANEASEAAMGSVADDPEPEPMGMAL